MRINFFLIVSALCITTLAKAQSAGITFNFGMGEQAHVLFNNSPVFKLAPEAGLKGVKPLAWFGTEPPLKSGWAWGQQYLKNGVAAFEAQVGKGKLYAFGPEITFRGQSHGTFKMLFNGLYK